MPLRSCFTVKKKKKLKKNGPVFMSKKKMIPHTDTQQTAASCLWLHHTPTVPFVIFRFLAASPKMSLAPSLYRLPDMNKSNERRGKEMKNHLYI